MVRKALGLDSVMSHRKPAAWGDGFVTQWVLGKGGRYVTYTEPQYLPIPTGHMAYVVIDHIHREQLMNGLAKVAMALVAQDG